MSLPMRKMGDISDTKNIDPNLDFKDFSGPHTLFFTEKEKLLSTLLVERLSQGFLSLTEFKQYNADTLVKSASYAFSQGQLTREQLGTLLELRQFLQAAVNVELAPLNPRLPTESISYFLSCELKETPELVKLERFFKFLHKKPLSEHFTINVTLDMATLPDRGCIELLRLLHENHIIHFQHNQLPPLFFSAERQLYTFTILSLGARDALTQTLYSTSAKALWPRLGKLTPKDIQKSTRQFARYAEFSYPGLPNTTSFHGIFGPMMFVTLHDEGHRRFLSRLINKSLTAYFHAIDVVIKKTGVEWSRDIWNATDLEVSLSTKVNYHHHPKTVRTITRCFEKLLFASIYSMQIPIGLFNRKEILFILLLDIIQHEKAWQKLNIMTGYLKKCAADLNLIRNHFFYLQFMPLEEQLANLLMAQSNQIIENNPVFKIAKYKNYIQLLGNNLPLIECAEDTYNKMKFHSFLRTLANLFLLFEEKNKIIQQAKKIRNQLQTLEQSHLISDYEYCFNIIKELRLLILNPYYHRPLFNFKELIRKNNMPILQDELKKFFNLCHGLTINKAITTLHAIKADIFSLTRNHTVAPLHQRVAQTALLPSLKRQA